MHLRTGRGDPRSKHPPTYKVPMGSTGVSGNSGLAKVVTGFWVVPELYDNIPNHEADETMQNTNELRT